MRTIKRTVLSASLSFVALWLTFGVTPSRSSAAAQAPIVSRAQIQAIAAHMLHGYIAAHMLHSHLVGRAATSGDIHSCKGNGCEIFAPPPGTLTPMSPNCYGIGCNGVSPQSSGCNAPAYVSTVQRITITGNLGSWAGDFALRRTSYCHAVWVDFYANADGVCSTLKVQDSSGYAQQYPPCPMSHNSTYWTDMVGDVPTNNGYYSDNNFGSGHVSG